MANSPRRPVLALEVTALDSMLSLIWMLLCVVVIIVLAYLFTRYVAGRRGLGGFGAPGGTGRFKALARLSLSDRTGATRDYESFTRRDVELAGEGLAGGKQL